MFGYNVDDDQDDSGWFGNLGNPFNPFSDEDDYDYSGGYFFPNIFRSNDEYEEDPQTRYEKYRNNLIIFAVTAILLFLIFWLLYKATSYFFTQVLSAQVAITLGIVVFACALYKLKKTRQELFGLVELTFALAVTFDSVGQTLDNHAKWLIILAAIAINIKGLETFWDGYSKRLQKLQER